MKKILKISSLAFLLFAGIACENDDQTIANAKTGPQLLTPVDGATYTLLPGNEDAEITTLVWNHADYSVSTEVNYEVEVALADTDFAEIANAGATTDRFLIWTAGALNQAALDAGLTPYTAGDLDVRIKATLGSNAEMVSYSNVVTLTVTPYTTDLPKLAVPGNHLGPDWNGGPAAAPKMAASGFGKTDYEGFMWLETAYKFVGPDATGNFAWGNTDWGDNGDFAGVLTADNEENCSSTPGYYRVKADTTALTYNAQAVTWGVIGNAVPVTEWNSDVDMTYSATTKKWSITMTLQAGEMKFRYNDTWNVGDAQWNLGLFDATKTGQNYGGEIMSYGGGNIPVTNAGTYLIELDLSNPRDYKYTLTQL
jgi:hypothetical protein